MVFILVIFRTWNLFLALGLRTFHLCVSLFDNISSFFFINGEGKWILLWLVLERRHAGQFSVHVGLILFHTFSTCCFSTFLP